MKVYQLHISLKHIEPLIWRRILVAADTPLPDLHKIIQTTMGWFNSHLHQFVYNGIYYGESSEFSNEEDVDYHDIKLNDLLKKMKDKLTYEYDFGDGWEHQILLEKIKNIDIGFKEPVCLAGERACPPEDIGGPPGYQYLLQVIANPKHKDYKHYKEWLGSEFDPGLFVKEEVNDFLREDDYGALSF